MRRSSRIECDVKLSRENRTIDPLDIRFDSLCIDSDSNIEMTGQMSGMKKIRVDRRSTLIINGNLSNIRKLKVDRDAKLIVRGSLRNCKYVESDRRSNIEVSNDVININTLESDRDGHIKIDGNVSNCNKVSRRGGSIEVESSNEENESNEDGADSERNRNFNDNNYDFEEDRLGNLESMEVNIPDNHLAVWISSRIYGIDVFDSKDFSYVHHNYPELDDILMKVDTIDKAIELSRKNANVEFTSEQIEMIRRAHNNADRSGSDEEIAEAITQAVDASELMNDIYNTTAVREDEEESDDEDTSEHNSAFNW